MKYWSSHQHVDKPVALQERQARSQQEGDSRTQTGRRESGHLRPRRSVLARTHPSMEASENETDERGRGHDEADNEGVLVEHCTSASLGVGSKVRGKKLVDADICGGGHCPDCTCCDSWVPVGVRCGDLSEVNPVVADRQ